jgi:hypothetical protein
MVSISFAGTMLEDRMRVNNISVYSRIVIQDLQKELGRSYAKDIEGGNKDKSQNDKNDPDKTAKAWEYFLTNYNNGKYSSIMKDLQNAGFEYPFDLLDRSGKDTGLLSWIDKTGRDLSSKGIKDKEGETKEYFLRLMPTEKGGRRESEGGLDIKQTLCLDESVRPTGEKLPIDVFYQKFQGKRFDQCFEFADLYVAILRHIGVDAHVVNYKVGDYKDIPWKLFSLNRGRNSWKEIDGYISRSGDMGHAYVYFQLGGEQQFVADVNGVFEKIQAPLDHFLSAPEEVAKYYVQKGSIDELQGKLEQGEKEMRLAMEIFPNDADTHRNLGNIYKDTGRTAQAISEYETAISLNADLPQVHSCLGEIYSNLHMNDKAIIEYQAAVRINPDDYKSHYALSVLYVSTGGIGLAINESKEVIRINPKASGPYYVLAIIYAATGRSDDAIDNLVKASSLDSSIIGRAMKDPNFDRIRNDGRFIKFLAGIR